MLIHPLDQKWAIENFKIIDEIFTRLNKSDLNLDRERKKMKVNMDTPRYRGYYQLARNEERRKADKAKSIADRKRHAEDQYVRSMNDENTARATDNLERCQTLLKNQLEEKDKLIAFLKKMMESTVFSMEAEL
tara:strand:- start:9 stop:407 length:399 start_codon:yes stop_codon:yes gene_type:complete